MNVLIFLPYGGISPHHFSLGLEIIEDHATKGDKITVLRCDALLKSCSFNLVKDRSQCIKCKDIFEQGMKLMEGDISVKDYKFLTSEDIKLIKELKPQTDTIDQLKNIWVDNYDLGMGVVSSVVSYYRDPKFDFASNKKLVNNLIYASLETYLSLKNHLTTGNYDVLYVYNGRYSEFRAAFKAALNLNTTVKVYEYGSDLTKYSAFTNFLPHSIKDRTELINKEWEEAEGTDREKKAAEFYELRRNGIPKMYYSYVAHQSADLLPEGFDKNQRNIVVFNSSEDELVAVSDEWKNTLYKTQNDGVIAVANSIKQRPDAANYHIYLRMHPNLAGLALEYDDRFAALDPNLFTLIPAASKVSTYALLDCADVVLAFGSTMGIEATYWGKPSIQLSPSFYQLMNVTYAPATHEEAMALITSKELQPKPQIGAKKYGFYINTFGIKKKISKMSDFTTLDTVKGVKLEPKGIAKLKMDLIFIYNNPAKFLKLKWKQIAGRPQSITK